MTDKSKETVGKRTEPTLFEKLFRDGRIIQQTTAKNKQK